MCVGELSPSPKGNWKESPLVINHLSYIDHPSSNTIYRISIKHPYTPFIIYRSHIVEYHESIIHHYTPYIVYRSPVVIYRIWMINPYVAYIFQYQRHYVPHIVHPLYTMYRLSITNRQIPFVVYRSHILKYHLAYIDHTSF